MMGLQIQAAIFDLDGVITDTASFHYKAWKRLADELGLYFDVEMNELLKGVDRMSSLEIILRGALREFKMDEKIVLCDRKNEYYKEFVETMTPDCILPGVLEVLQLLKNKEIKIGLASVSKNAFTVINKLGIGNYFDYMADAAKIQKGKPDPEIFLTVAENLKVDVRNCIGIEDAEAGVKAIKAAKIYAIGIGDSKILCEADDVIKGLNEFKLEKYINIFMDLPGFI